MFRRAFKAKRSSRSVYWQQLVAGGRSWQRLPPLKISSSCDTPWQLAAAGSQWQKLAVAATSKKSVHHVIHQW